jgi:pimeloyl-ACP methyl ester carboxylesterase
MPEFATAADLRESLARYDAEARPGAFPTGRYRLRYVTWGDGPPVVFVHGLCDLSRSFAMVMRRLVDAGFRVVGYELADGAGDGAKLGSYRHPDYAADLVALLDHLGIPQVNVTGSSFGSTVTLRALAEHPDRFRRAAVQGGFARRPLIRVERWLAQLGRSWPWRMGDLPVRDAVMAKLERPMFEGAPDEVFRFLLGNSGRTPIRAAAWRALVLDELDLRPTLATIPHPVLMIGGDRDTIIWRSLEEEVEAGVKSCRRVEFAPCGHYPQYTLPGPMAAELIGFFS